MEQGRQLSITDNVVDAKDSLNNTWFRDGETIYLKLGREDKLRTLGKVKGDTFYTKRVRERHLFKMNQSYGFNINILEQLGVQFIELYEDSGIFKFPVDILRRYGDYLHFKDEGFERQLFLSLLIIDMYRYTPEADARRIELMGQEWFNLLKPEFDKEYMIELGQFLAARRKEVEVYPESKDMFRAYKMTPYSEMKVLIISQDPYFTKGVADGLAFSSNLPTYLPPTLVQVFGAIEWDFNTINLDRNPKLDRWAKQGVLLTNTILTVEQNKPRSHQGLGWETFITQVLLQIKNHPRNLVVMLWGGAAKAFRPSIDNGRHLILEAEHPVAASRNNRDWENHGCFSKCNNFLITQGYGGIEW